MSDSTSELQSQTSELRHSVCLGAGPLAQQTPGVGAWAERHQLPGPGPAGSGPSLRASGMPCQSHQPYFAPGSL